MAEHHTIPLSQICVDYDLQTRAKMEACAVDDFAAAMADTNSAKFPPLDVFRDGAHFLLVDGFHRHKAAIKAGLKEFACVVHEGDRNAALWFSVGANKANNSVLRTGADKRRAIELALKQFHSEKNQQEIARQVGCSQGYVARVSKAIITSNNGATRKNKSGVTRPTAYKKGPPSKEAVLIARLEKKRAGLIEESRFGTPEEFNRWIASPNFRRFNPKIPLVIKVRKIDKQIARLKTAMAKAANAKKSGAQKPPLDDTNFPIPESLLPLWKMRDAMRDHLRLASDHLSAYKRADDEKNPLYAGLKIGEIITDLDRMHGQLKVAIPHAVCICLGKDGSCGWCHGRGLVGKHNWEQIPSERKDERNA